MKQLSWIRAQWKNMRVGLILPREHGAWALWLVPFFLGIMMTHFRPAHLLLFGSVFFAFTATTPAVLMFKQPHKRAFHRRWLVAELGLSLLCGGWLLPTYPKLIYLGLAAIFCLLIDYAFIRAKRERHLVNDLAGIIGLNLAVVASYYVGVGHITFAPFGTMVVMGFFFFGSALHVKAMIRERKDAVSKIVAFGYHLFLIVLYTAMGVSWWLVIGALLALVRVTLQPQNSKLSVPTIGILEICLAIVYFLLYAMSVKPQFSVVGWQVIGLSTLLVLINYIFGVLRSAFAKKSLFWFFCLFASLPVLVTGLVWLSLSAIWIPVLVFTATAGQIFGGRAVKFLQLRTAELQKSSKQMEESPL